MWKHVRPKSGSNGFHGIYAIIHVTFILPLCPSHTIQVCGLIAILMGTGVLIKCCQFYMPIGVINKKNNKKKNNCMSLPAMYTCDSPSLFERQYIPPPIVCIWNVLYENGSCGFHFITYNLNRYIFRHINANGFLFLTQHTTPLLYVKIHFGVLH